MANILVVDDEPGIREFVMDTLATDGHRLAEASSGAAAIERLRLESYDLLITDLRMPGNVDGMDVVREARHSHPDTRVIVLTAYGSVTTAVDAMKLGAHDFLEKPVSGPTELRILVSRALGDPDHGETSGTVTERLAKQVARALGSEYQVDALIAQGGYAAVFGVLDSRLDRKLAAKVLLPDFAASADTAERFRREARTMARLAHPGIMPVYFVARERDVPCFVMPRLGDSIASLRAREGSLRIPQVLRLARDVAGALDYAHRMGVVHRDLKPQNILVDTESGRAILTDFGIAKAVAPAGVTATAPGIFLGTPRYASPEQITGEIDVDERSDIYSFAVVIYEMISGRAPFVGANTNKIVMQHLVAPVPPLSQFMPAVNRAMDGVIARALAKDPFERFASAGAFMMALEAAARLASH